MKRLIATLLLCAAGQSWAQDEPIGFKSVKLGASLADFRSAFPDFDCRQNNVCLFDRELHCLRKIAGPVEGAACATRNTWAGVNVLQVFAWFEAGALRRVSVTFKPQDFEQIVAAATERWGRPKHESTEEIQNRMGARFENRFARWEQGGVGLAVRRYGSRVDAGSALIISTADVIEAQKRRGEAGKEAAKDL